MNNLRNLAYSFLGLFISLMILTACAVPATPAHSTEPSSEPLTSNRSNAKYGRTRKRF